tara:strand:- start:3714 stop:5531 length:1818 start_codon:yes stop_codon:yes gene_type:complete
LGLENLKSIFTEGMSKFKNTKLTTIDSRFTEDFKSLADDFQSNSPLLGESIVVDISSKHTEGIGGLFNKSTTYTSTKFEPMSSLNVPSIEQILKKGNEGGGYQLQKSSYDKYFVTTPGEDINVSGIAIRTVDGLGNLISDVTKNRKSPNDTSWSNLYDSNHKSKGVGINYSPNVRSVFSIRDNAPNVRGISRNPLGGTQGEPYIISNLPSGDVGGLDGGRLQNFASRSIPIIRAVTDTLRLTKYLTSPSGLLFFAKQNALGLFSRVDYPGTLLGSDEQQVKIGQQRFGTFYNPLSTLGSTLGRLLGTTPNVLIRRDELLPTGYPPFDKYENQLGLTKLHNTFGGSSELISAFTTFPIAKGIKSRPMGRDLKPIKSGDKMTIAPMIKGTTDDLTFEKLNVEIEEEKNGMPFYFKDLRDNTYIFFRAYIDGLTENISPNWDPTNYLGRSEPVYVYSRSERDISFNLKLFAHTPSELDSIYQKMNRLTSLCYPEYAKDTVGSTTNEEGETVFAGNALQRMKPPLTKFRLGELFGSKNNELMGFIKSLSYTYPQESTWETKQGKRVPKYILVAISYQVIHMKVPSLDFAKNKDETFYGTNKAENGVGVN